MELLEGETLRDAARRAARCRSRKAVDVARADRRGLAAAHEKGIVHRDLKPENMFLTRDGRVKILDFGLAKRQRAARARGDRAARHAAATAPGTVLGTVGYMSPEQVRGEAVDHRVRHLRLGASSTRCSPARRAFERQHRRRDAERDPEGRPAARSPEPGPAHSAPALERIVRHCLEKNPEERFQSARDLAFDLEAQSGSTRSGAS